MYGKDILDEAKTRVKKYKRRRIAVLLSYYALIAVCFFLMGYGGWSLISELLTVFVMFLFFIVNRRAAVRFSNKYIMSAVTEECDPELALAIFDELKAAWYDPSRLTVYRLLGDHQTAVTACNRILTDSKCRKKLKRLAPHCIAVIADCYFELGDDDKLRSAVNGFYKYASAQRNRERIERAFPKMRFYRMYLNDEYEGCLSYIAVPLPANTLYIPSCNELRRGMVYLKMGDTERARKEFRRAVEVAPKMSYAAARQLSLLESPDAADSDTDVLPLDGDACRFEAPSPSLKRIVTLIASAILCALLLMGASTAGERVACDRAMKQYGRDMEKYSQYVVDAAEKEHNGVGFVTALNVDKDGKPVCVLAFCETDGGLAVGEMLNYDEYEGETDVDVFDTVTVIPYDVIEGDGELPYLSHYSPATERVVCGGMYRNKNECPDETYFVIEMKVKNTRILFAVEFIGEPEY